MTDLISTKLESTQDCVVVVMWIYNDGRDSLILIYRDMLHHLCNTNKPKHTQRTSLVLRCLILKLNGTKTKEWIHKSPTLYYYQLLTRCQPKWKNRSTTNYLVDYINNAYSWYWIITHCRYSSKILPDKSWNCCCYCWWRKLNIHNKMYDTRSKSNMLYQILDWTYRVSYNGIIKKLNNHIYSIYYRIISLSAIDIFGRYIQMYIETRQGKAKQVQPFFQSLTWVNKLLIIDDA